MHLSSQRPWLLIYHRSLMKFVFMFDLLEQSFGEARG